MAQHTDLIERLRASSEDGLTPDDAYAAAEALEAQAREIAELKAQESELCTLYGLAQAECQKLRAEVEGLRKDAACFRFWVREAAVNPCDMAKLIMRCTTEQEYRDAIEPLATAAEDAIRAAMKGQL